MKEQEQGFHSSHWTPSEHDHSRTYIISNEGSSKIGRMYATIPLILLRKSSAVDAFRDFGVVGGGLTQNAGVLMRLIELEAHFWMGPKLKL